jgi:hypothetical protein
VKYALDGTAPVKTFGTIRLDFDGRARNIDVPFIGCLQKGGAVTKDLGDIQGLQQGRVEITGERNHFIGPTCNLGGPNPVKLKIQLIDPSGTVVATAEGYSIEELRSELPKLKLIYQVTKCTPGRWKLRISNIDDDDDAIVLRPTVKFTPGCP